MGAFKDLTGKRFGRLMVLEQAGRNKHKQILWKCQCDCGNSVSVLSASLRTGNTQSCGCYHKERASNASSKDLTGQRFGRLTALSRDKTDNWGTHYWLCRCDCGVEKLVLGASLTRGATTSCGCLRKEKPALYRTKDLTGKRFVRLIVKSVAGVNKSNSCLWLCQCDT